MAHSSDSALGHMCVWVGIDAGCLLCCLGVVDTGEAGE